VILLQNDRNIVKDVLLVEALANTITSVKKGSIAEELEIEPGDILVSINGQAIKDIIDYKYLISDEYIELLVKKRDGEEWILEIEKEYDEDIGIEFENPIIDKAKGCSNKCIFCFIDQLPKGMRKSLYFKDDDSRLSFLQGNFITLTNMCDDDIDRIIRYKISPLNISVHTTDPELRVKMLRNKRAGNIMDLIERLVNGGIDINCQIVLLSGINDGEALRKTIKDLFNFYPRIKNVAVVPVGLTRFREKLYPLVPFDKESSNQVIDLIGELQEHIFKSTGDYFVRCADEFYIMAGRQIPEPWYYGEFEQLEDGIGMIAYFMDNIRKSLKSAPIRALHREVSLITGVSPYLYMQSICEEVESVVQGLKINIYPIKNNFFGEKITVTGLLTGKDIIEQLKGKSLGDFLLLPSNILRSGDIMLLDDTTVEDLEKELGIVIRVCSFDGKDFLQKIME